MQRLRLTNTEKEKSPGKGRLSTVTFSFTKKISNLTSNFCVHRMKGIQPSFWKEQINSQLENSQILFRIFTFVCLHFLRNLRMFIVTFETLNAQPFNTRLLGKNSAFRIDSDWYYGGRSENLGEQAVTQGLLIVHSNAAKIWRMRNVEITNFNDIVFLTFIDSAAYLSP